MFTSLFSAIDWTLKCAEDYPRVVGLFGVFLFLSCIVGISSWEVQKKTPHQTVSMVPSSCSWRASAVFPEKESRPREVSVNDDCGAEAKAWSRRLVLEAQAAASQREFLPDTLLNNEIVSMTEGYPIEQMAMSIARYDREVAALIVGIAKKESNWGKRVPRSADGTDCFNYWGFKGAGSRGVAMGHGCFGSPEEAVEKVGDRIAELVRIRGASEPKNFTIWKCGSSCSTHSPESVRKWVSDVDQYYRVLVASR